MREILFRGKTNKGKWVEGDLYQSRLKSIFMISRYTEHGNRMTEVVDPETVGQYTGLNAKNGKIFDGDIVRGRHWTSYNNKNIEEYHLWRVDWSEKSGLITFIDSPTTKFKLSIHDFADFEEVEIIGNIHDNPELLKGGAE